MDPQPSGLAFSRVLLKLSGEALQGDGKSINPEVINRISREVKEVVDLGIQMALGYRRRKHLPWGFGGTAGMARATADYMGMLATTINALALQDALEKQGSKPGYRPQSKCGRSPSRTFVDAPIDISSGAGSHLCRRNGQPVLYDGHCGLAERHGDRRRGDS